jgi:hexosaminidase
MEMRPVMPHTLALVPNPVTCRETGGTFRLDRATPLILHGDTPEMRRTVDSFNEMCAQTFGVELPIVGAEDGIGSPIGVHLAVVRRGKGASNETYRLSAKESGVWIEAHGTPGLFYGLQTFLQMIPSERRLDDGIMITGVEIDDRPRFTWRGMHLDVSRHFMPVDFIRKFIDLLAHHKMNVFHWHLTDDQGWRLEIKRYPRLTDVAAWRSETGGNRYGGFYTQDDIRNIVAYARRHFVTIVPEIEMPGHARAVLAAYPHLSCTGGPFEVATTWGIFDDVFCAGNDKTFQFLENVLTEFIHIGGDECPKARWQEHDLCQTRILRENLMDENELQSWFISRIARFLSDRDKRLIGWDEILEGGAPEGGAVMAWRGINKGIEAARAGCDVVMTPTSHCYFDYYQAKDNEPRAIGGHLPLETVYSFEPMPDGLTLDEGRHILGGQGNIWTEYMPDTRHVEYMTFPRACAMAEVLWSPRESRSYPDFVSRLRHHLLRLGALGVNYRPLTP